MKLLIFSLLLCLGASLKGQDANGRTNIGFQSADAPNFTINEIGPPNFILVDDCKPTQTIKTVSGKLLAICVDGKFEPWMGLAPNSGQTHMLPLTIANQDVPAIQEKDTRIFYCGQGGPRCDHGEHFDKPDGFATMCRDDAASQKLENSCGKTRWTCSDPHNYALLTSVDGEIHTCHRISQ